MDGKKFDKNTLKTLVIAASLLLNWVLGGASYTYYHHLAEQMNETASPAVAGKPSGRLGLRPAGAGGRIPADH